ncbi:aspartate aminotransferase [Blattamonas nauphoetae]|uniref:Aspartate aminotransferase n=1 Tax=Blattamonas nauphoetae TaxID=2049346 RepID=A0ABQ9YHX1_9EUKA|nr:aspartate aminotransferase [Blattamonas nauphoetae]
MWDEQCLDGTEKEKSHPLYFFSYHFPLPASFFRFIMSLSLVSIVSQTTLAELGRASNTRKIFEESNQRRQTHGSDVCDFSLGNSVVSPPQAFREALQQISLDPPSNVHSYLPTTGLPQLRENIAKCLTKWHNVEISKDCVLMACGASAAINIVLHTILPADSEVIIPTPCFGEYIRYVENMRCKVVLVPCLPNYELDVEAIRAAINDKTRVILLNNPNNPTGKVYSQKTLVDLSKVLMDVFEHRKETTPDNPSPVFLLSDEIYRLIHYDQSTPIFSTFAAYPYSFLVSSFAKDFALPGERIGYICISPALVDQCLIDALSSSTRVLGYVGCPSMMQHVLCKCLENGFDYAPVLAEYRKRRDRLHAILLDAGLQCPLPEAAVYLFPKVPEGVTDKEFADLLRAQNVFVVPGSSFLDPTSVRLAFCVDMDVIEKSAPKIKLATQQARAHHN